MIAVIAAVVALSVGAIVLLSGGDGGTQADPSPVPETASITAAEELAFQAACEAQGVSTDLCGCAKIRAIEQLDAPAFRENLSVMLEEEGALLPAFNALFEACVDEGF